MRIELGAPVIIATLAAGLGGDLYHLPTETRSARGPGGRKVQQRFADFDLPPVTWPTLCGLEGVVYGDGVMRGRRACPVCRAALPASQLTASVTYVEPRPVPRRSSTRVPQLTDAQADVVYRLYVEKRIGTPALGRMFWQRLGHANATSCANAITRAFKLRGLELRSRGECHGRTLAGKRLFGFGGQNPGEQRLTGRTIDRLWGIYQAGYSVPQIARRFHARFGYATADRFAFVVEYAWKQHGWRLRTSSEAELLSRARMKRRCAAMKTGADGRRPRPCAQRALPGSEFCLHHDPARAADVRARADALRARKPVVPKVAWAKISPLLKPLLVPRPDPRGRRRAYETASGALARHTGVDSAITSRLLKRPPAEVTVALANRLLAPLAITVADLDASEEIAA